MKTIADRMADAVALYQFQLKRDIPEGEIGKLDHRVKWFFAQLEIFRKTLDGKFFIITGILDLDNPREYHKDGLAGDGRTKDMTREVRMAVRLYAFALRNAINPMCLKEGWRFGFDPHDETEKHDIPWSNEHFHAFATPFKAV